jgi:outer membrane lipoprotein carrier protein
MMIRLLSILFFFVSSMATAQTAKQQLQVFSQDLQTAQTTFHQLVSGPNGEKVQSAQGTLKLKTPNQFRWQYTKPTSQLIVADGSKIWIYEADLQQVTVKTQDALNQDNPLSALTNPLMMDKFYNTTELTKKQGVSRLQLIPKNKQNSPFEKALLGFTNNTLVSMQLFDALGQVSTFSFGSWQNNKKLDAKLFQFVVPKGVDVVE